MSTTEFLKRQVGVFKAFPVERLRQLAGGSRAASFEAREAIAHQGAEATHFGDVLVRVNPSFALAMHTDTDEANAANVGDGMQGYIEGIQSEG